MKTECDYLYGWIKKKWSHIQKSYPKRLTPEEEEVTIMCLCSFHIDSNCKDRGLDLQAVACGIFWSSLPGVFSGYSSFLPSFISKWFSQWNKSKINAISTLSNLIAELSLHTMWHTTRHVARDKRSMFCTWFVRDYARATWAYVLETVHSAVRRLSKISNCTFECDYHYYYYYYTNKTASVANGQGKRPQSGRHTDQTPLWWHENGYCGVYQAPDIVWSVPDTVVCTRHQILYGQCQILWCVPGTRYCMVSARYCGGYCTRRQILYGQCQILWWLLYQAPDIVWSVPDTVAATVPGTRYCMVSARYCGGYCTRHQILYGQCQILWRLLYQAPDIVWSVPDTVAATVPGTRYCMVSARYCGGYCTRRQILYGQCQILRWLLYQAPDIVWSVPDTVAATVPGARYCMVSARYCGGYCTRHQILYGQCQILWWLLYQAPDIVWSVPDTVAATVPGARYCMVSARYCGGYCTRHQILYGQCQNWLAQCQYIVAG